MTANQLRYWELQEQKRSNLAKETETNRSNLAKETETHRANVASEAIKVTVGNKGVVGHISDLLKLI